MRKLVLILFLAMLPLQWTAAAVAALCLPDARAPGPVQVHVDGQADEVDHAHDRAPASPGGLAGPHHGGQDHGHHDTLHAGHGDCCHAACSALLPPFVQARVQATPADLVARMTGPIVSHPSESPFRPPRLALA